jgi:hypothetical protein
LLIDAHVLFSPLSSPALIYFFLSLPCPSSPLPSSTSNSELKSRAPNNIILAQLDEYLQEMNNAGM